MEEQFLISGQVPFGPVYAPIFEDPRVNTHMIAAYAYICMRAGFKGKAWPGQGTIAEATHMSRKTANKAIKKLEEYGYIKVLRRKKESGAKDSCLYVINAQNKPLNEDTHVYEGNIPCNPHTHGMCTTVTRDVYQGYINNNNEHKHRTITNNNNSECRRCSKDSNNLNIVDQEKKDELSTTTTRLINSLNKLTGKKFKPSKTIQSYIQILLKDYSETEILNVIEIKVRQFMKSNKVALATPKFLFSDIERFDELYQEAMNQIEPYIQAQQQEFISHIISDSDIEIPIFDDWNYAGWEEKKE